MRISPNGLWKSVRRHPIAWGGAFVAATMGGVAFVGQTSIGRRIGEQIGIVDAPNGSTGYDPLAQFDTLARARVLTPTIDDGVPETHPFADWMNTPKDPVGFALANAYPALPLDDVHVAEWKSAIAGVEDTGQALVLEEMILRGVITRPDDVAKYRQIWERSPIPEMRSSPSRTTHRSAVPYIEEVLRVGGEILPEHLKMIPDRRTLDGLLNGEYGPKIREGIQKHWRILGTIFGHIIYSQDLSFYSEMLHEDLRRQEIQPKRCSRGFHAPLVTIDLNTLERRFHTMRIDFIDSNRVIWKIFIDGQMEVGVINPRDTSTIKGVLRRVFPQEEQYLLVYYPKTTFTDGAWTIGTDYEQRDRFRENLIGRDDYANNLGDAVANYGRAVSYEDAFYRSEKESFMRSVDPNLADAIRDEKPLPLKDIYDLMLIMADSTAENEVIRAFGLTRRQYNTYKEALLKVLDERRGLTRDELLLEVTRVLDGRVTLAAVILYNTLLPLGEIGNNALFTRYPETFAMVPDIQDQAGSIYHYYGCFFASYALQRSLVEPYYNDKDFRGRIDNERRAIYHRAQWDWSSGILHGVDAFEILLLIQYQMLADGEANQRELMSLAGVFFEEVLEDREISREPFEDIRGVAAGHAFYATLFGRTLRTNDPERRFFVDSARSAVLGRLTVMQKLGWIWRLGL